MKGKFIVFEALDAAGKSTQVDQLVHKLTIKGIKVWKTKECTDNYIGSLIKKEYLSGNVKCDEKVINILMAADRLEHVASQNGILDHLNKGEWVICDRFVWSGMAYDNYMHTDKIEISNGFDYTYNMNKVALSKIVPDMTIFIDVSPNVCVERIESRGENKEVFETLEKLEAIRKSYMNSKIYLCDQQKYNMNVVHINGEDSIDNVAKAIYAEVEKQFL